MKQKGIIYVIILILLLSGYSLIKWLYNSTSYSVFDKNMENIKETSNPGEAIMVGSSSIKNQSIESLKQDRKIARENAIEEYKRIISNPDISNDSKKECEKKIIEINDLITKEQQAESMISSRKIGDAIVYTSPSAITVTIDAPTLSSPQISQIKDIVSEIISTKNIKIVEVNKN